MDWTEQKERSNNFTLKLILWIAIHLRRGVTRLLLHPITFYYLLTSPRIRHCSRDFLSTATQKSSGIGGIYQHILTFASTILDRVFLLTNRHDLFEVKIENLEVVAELLRNNQGAILLGSHLGSFEVLRTLGLANDKLKLKVLMHYDHNQMISTILDGLNYDIAETVIDLGREDALIKAAEFVKQGYLLGVLGDRSKGSDRNIRVEFMGRTTSFPTGPALLAAIYNVPVVLFFGIYTGKNNFHIFFEKLCDIPSVKRGERDVFITELTRKYVKRLEYYATKYPYNWFNFYDFWEQ